MSDYSQIALDVADGVATITLDRPDQLNAFTITMMDELLDAFDRTDADDGVRAVVVTGRGRAFCAGADLSMGGATFDDAATGRTQKVGVKRDEGGIVALRIYASHKPVIGALNGSAVGVGLTMTLPMDVRVVADNAKLGFVFARRGIVPEACSSWFLPRIVGISQALDWALSGRIFSGTEAAEAGLMREAAPADQVLAKAYEIARDIADNTSAISVSLIRHMFWQGLSMDHPMRAHEVESRGVSATGMSPDAAEGVGAFLQKRPANFPGKPSTDMPSFFPWWDEPRFR